MTVSMLTMGALCGCGGGPEYTEGQATDQATNVQEVEQALAGGSYGQLRYVQNEADQKPNIPLAVHATSWVNVKDGVGRPAPTVTRTGTGIYLARFAGLAHTSGNGGNVQVVAHGINHNGAIAGQRCKVISWGPDGADLVVNVMCFSNDGYPSNSMFSLVYHRETSTGSQRGAYVWANQPTTPTYIPDSRFQWNSATATNSIARTSTGVYDVLLPRLTVIGGNVQVTAYGANANYCKVENWTTSNGQTHVLVRCFDNAGFPVDSLFAMDYQLQPLGVGDLGGFLWAHDPTSADYVPVPPYTFNSFSTTPNRAGRASSSATHSTYTVRYTGLASTTAVHLATAYGPKAEHCFTLADTLTVFCECPPGKGDASAVLFSDRVSSRLAIQ